jgi:hypothetical protein
MDGITVTQNFSCFSLSENESIYILTAAIFGGGQVAVDLI